MKLEIEPHRKQPYCRTRLLHWATVRVRTFSVLSQYIQYSTTFFPPKLATYYLLPD